MELSIGDQIKVEFMGRVRNGRIVRKGRLDGGTVKTVFISFDDDPLGHKRSFGFRASQVEVRT